MKKVILSLAAVLFLSSAADAAGRRQVSRARSSTTTTVRTHSQPGSTRQISEAFRQNGYAFGEDALSEVNADRAAWGLPLLRNDPQLAIAAEQCAITRAKYRVAGHLTGGGGDFAYLPPGAHADAAGCGALEPSWGWGTCCTDERGYTWAGAAVVMGNDGKRYMHIFCRK